MLPPVEDEPGSIMAALSLSGCWPNLWRKGALSYLAIGAATQGGDYLQARLNLIFILIVCNLCL